MWTGVCRRRVTRSYAGVRRATVGDPEWTLAARAIRRGVFGHAHRLAEAGLSELELVFDFAATAPARTKAVVSQQPARGAVLPKRRGGKGRQAVGVRVVDREADEGGADAHPSERVGDLDQELGDPASSFNAYVAGDAHDRVVALVDCGDGLVVEV